MLVLIGNSPSTGSTYLADLIDSTPGFICGPESRFFCYSEIYDDFEYFKKHFKNPLAFDTPSLQNFRGSVSQKPRVLEGYGLDKKALFNLIESSDYTLDYAEKIRKQLIKFRKADKDSILVEKYPENILIASSFLEKFEDGYLIQIVRDPLYVYNSLRGNKKFPSLLAIATWMLSTTVGYHLLNHPRVITIKYEDLVLDPFRQIAEIGSKISGKFIDDKEVKENYDQNMYRKNYEARDKNWSVQGYGKTNNANKASIKPEIEEEYHQFKGLKLSREFEKIHGIKPVTIEELCDKLGYPSPKNGGTIPNTVSYKKHMLQKYLFDQLKDFKAYQKISMYLNPLTK